MDFALSSEQQAIRDAVGRSAAASTTSTGSKGSRRRLSRTISTRRSPPTAGSASASREEYGGAGLGVTEAALMMQTIAESGAGLSGASALHMNIFGLNPVVVFGTDEQKRRMLPPLIAGEDKACFAVTEPNTGLNTTQLKTRAVRDGDRYVVDGQKIWISTAQVADKMLLLARTTPLEEVKRRPKA